jgi:hypothetical protein
MVVDEKVVVTPGRHPSYTQKMRRNILLLLAGAALSAQTLRIGVDPRVELLSIVFR